MKDDLAPSTDLSVSGRTWVVLKATDASGDVLVRGYLIVVQYIFS
jgi:hypothetical protein